MVIENFKDSTKTFLELTDNFSKVLKHQINIHKSVLFLYANYKVAEIEIKKTIPFTMESRGIKHLEIHLTTEMKDLYTENYKTLMKEIEKNTNNSVLTYWKN